MLFGQMYYNKRPGILPNDSYSSFHWSTVDKNVCVSTKYMSAKCFSSKREGIWPNDSYGSFLWSTVDKNICGSVGEMFF
jgi:hypothetical protein